MFCIHCGAEVAEEEKFCPFCGKKLSLEEENDESLNQGETVVLGESGQAGEKVAASDTPAVDDTVVIATPSSEGSQGASAAPQAGDDMSGLSVFVNPNPPAASGAGETQEFVPVAGQKMNASGVGVASSAEVAGSQGSGEPAPKKPRNVVAAVVAAVAAVLLLAGVGLFALGGNADAAEVSVVTRIMPKDESGSALKDYTAQIEAEDGSRYQTRVQGSEGFTYADFGKIPYGPYTLVIINNNGDTYGPYKTVYEEETDKKPKPKPWDPVNDPTGKAGNGAGGKIGKVKKEEDTERTIEVDTEELKKAAYAAYYEKCQEYMALTDGTVGEERYYEDLQNEAVWCAGLNMVDLVDFNQDGIEELVVVYYDESTGPDSFEEEADYEAWQENYTVEVWEHRDDKLVNIYQGGLPCGPNPATIIFSYCSWGEGKDAVPGVYFQGYDENGSTTSLWKYQNEALAAVNQFESIYDNEEEAYSYFVNGEEVSEGEYESAYDGAFAQLSNTPMRTLFLNDRSVSDTSDEDDSDGSMSYSSVREMTMENIDILREAAGAPKDEVAVSESSDEPDDSSDYEAEEGESSEFSIADYAGEYGFVEADGMWLDLSIGAAGEDTWLLCWHNPEMASDADFTFAMEDGVTSYTVTDNRNTSGETEYQFDFVFGDGWVDVTITRIYDEYEIVPEGTFTFYKE